MDEDPEVAVQSLMFDLQRINAAAYAERYDKVRPAVSVPCGGKILPLPSLLKALQCIRYNCDGGDSRGALTTLNAVIESVKDEIISNLPDYKSADWFL